MAVREPIVAIVGRPNVGKSTLFNRILGQKKAVVQDEPGVTRDRNYARIERFSVPFHLIDTGGFEAEPDDELTQAVVDQTLCAAQDADIVFCLFDAHSGLHPGDGEVMQMLRQRGCPVVYIANKCDGQEQAALKAEFYALGMDELKDVSALHGRGVGQLVEETLKSLPQYEALLSSVRDRAKEREAREEAAREALEAAIADDRAAALEIEEEEKVVEPLERNPEDAEFAPVFVPDDARQTPDEYLREFRTAPAMSGMKPGEDGESAEEPEEILPELDCIRIAIVGRPNVGKSTLLNTLLGERRAITSDIAGTTRDCLDQEMTRDGQKYLLVDTAGLRKKARVSDTIERYSTIRAINAMRDADVAVVLIDATTGPSEQDSKIIGIAHESGKGIVIGVNKWDAVKKDHRSVKEMTDDIRDAFKFCRYAPIVFISALSGKRCPRVIETAKDVAVQRMRRVHTGRLNRVLKRAHKRFSPPAYRGRALKLFFASQVSAAPPTFVLFFNYSRSLHFSYLRFLKNSLRDEFSFHGTDLRLLVRKRGGEAKFRRKK